MYTILPLLMIYLHFVDEYFIPCNKNNFEFKYCNKKLDIEIKIDYTWNHAVDHICIMVSPNKTIRKPYWIWKAILNNYLHPTLDDVYLFTLKLLTTCKLQQLLIPYGYFSLKFWIINLSFKIFRHSSFVIA